jgi:hypothetical protein
LGLGVRPRGGGQRGGARVESLIHERMTIAQLEPEV